MSRCSTKVLKSTLVAMACLGILSPSAHSRQPQPRTVEAYWKEAKVRQGRVEALQAPGDKKQFKSHWDTRTSHISGLDRFVKTACAPSVKKPAAQCSEAKADQTKYRQARVAQLKDAIEAGKVDAWILMNYTHRVHTWAEKAPEYRSVPVVEWMRSLSDRLEAESAAKLKTQGGMKARVASVGTQCRLRYASDKPHRSRSFLEADKGDVVITCHFSKPPAAAKGGLTDSWELAQHQGLVNKRVSTLAAWNKLVKRPSSKKTVSVKVPASALAVRGGTMARFVGIYRLHWDEKIKRGRAVSYRQHNSQFMSPKVYLHGPKMTKRPKLEKAPR